MNTGRCPKCEKLASRLKVEEVQLDSDNRKGMTGYTFLCPGCNSILGVEFHPDIRERLLKGGKR